MRSIEIETASREVMRYFLEHPSAVDSLEGIAHWRLQRQRVRDVVAETDAALSALVEQKVIDRINVTGGPALFRLNPQKREVVQRIVEDDA